MSAVMSFAVSRQYASMKSALCSSSAALAAVTVSAIKAKQIIAFIDPSLAATPRITQKYGHDDGREWLTHERRVRALRRFPVAFQRPHQDATSLRCSYSP